MRRWYVHELLEQHREPEPITNDTAKQFLRQIEFHCEMRGLTLTNGSHDIIAYVYGIEPKDRELYKQGILEPTEEMKSRASFPTASKAIPMAAR